jgi:hypothetical protein
MCNNSSDCSQLPGKAIPHRGETIPRFLVLVRPNCAHLSLISHSQIRAAKSHAEREKSFEEFFAFLCLNAVFDPNLTAHSRFPCDFAFFMADWIENLSQSSETA